MINILIRENTPVKTIKITGHADYNEYGKDIVCASVSTIFQLATMGLRTLAEQYPDNIKIEEVE